MMAHLAREPARGTQDDPSSSSHVLAASQTGADSTFRLFLDQDESQPDWGASPRRSGGNQHWRVVYFTAASTASADNAFNFTCGADGSPPPSGISSAARTAYPGIRRHQIDVPLTTFDGLPAEATGIAWRLSLPDNAGACGDGTDACPVRQVHVQTDPGDSRSWQCFDNITDPFNSP